MFGLKKFRAYLKSKQNKFDIKNIFIFNIKMSIKATFTNTPTNKGKSRILYDIKNITNELVSKKMTNVDKTECRTCILH